MRIKIFYALLAFHISWAEQIDVLPADRIILPLKVTEVALGAPFGILSSGNMTRYSLAVDLKVDIIWGPHQRSSKKVASHPLPALSDVVIRNSSLYVEFEQKSVRYQQNLCDVAILDTKFKFPVAEAINLEASSISFVNRTYHGVLGLSFPRRLHFTDGISKSQQSEPLPVYLYEKEHIELPAFSIHIMDGSRGDLILGLPDSSRHTDALQYFPVVHHAAWNIGVSAFGITSSMFVSEKEKFVATFDSLSRYIGCPFRHFLPLMSDFKSKIGKDSSDVDILSEKDGVYSIDCAFSGKVPSITFELTGTDGPSAFTIPGKEMVINEDGKCRLALALVNDRLAGPDVVLGLPFLRRFYTVFDFGTRDKYGIFDSGKVGLAPINKKWKEPAKAKRAVG